MALYATSYFFAECWRRIILRLRRTLRKQMVTIQTLRIAKEGETCLSPISPISPNPEPWPLISQFVYTRVPEHPL